VKIVGIAAVAEFSIYIDIEDVKKVEAEERDKFIKSILEETGIPLDDVWPDEELNDKEKFRALMRKYDVDIIFDASGAAKIYVGNDVIAEWFKPRYILKKDPQAKRTSQKLFYEMIISNRSLFEENENV
jgi:hypothetical protein